MKNNKILNLIQRNRISSVEVSDALHKTGVMAGLTALNAGHFAAGEIRYVYAHSASNWPVHEQIRGELEDKILYVDTFDCGDRAIFGDIVAKYLFLYKKVRAIIVNGNLRDAHRLRKEDYPIWCRGVTPLGCTNHDIRASQEVNAEADRRRNQYENSLCVCDDSGVTFIAPENISEATYDRLDFIELQEDIWYYCIDTLKWDTYETICEKRYLKDRNVLPEAIRLKLMKYDEP